MLVDAVAADGTSYPSLALPYSLGDAPRATPQAAPGCGADTDRVLAALGLGDAEIGQLRRSGAVA
jgi:crotonobetainyl-CoA:carnitine CoA-transferase CaiB-like acyl-CoA transferase